MDIQSIVVTIVCYKFASLVKVYLKCLQILSILVYVCTTQEAQLTFT